MRSPCGAATDGKGSRKHGTVQTGQGCCRGGVVVVLCGQQPPPSTLLRGNLPPPPLPMFQVGSPLSLTANNPTNHAAIMAVKRPLVTHSYRTPPRGKQTAARESETLTTTPQKERKGRRRKKQLPRTVISGSRSRSKVGPVRGLNVTFCSDRPHVTWWGV
jgi:hypothetical protein